MTTGIIVDVNSLFCKLFSEENPLNKGFTEEIEISLPNDGLIEDYTFVFKAKGIWKFWPDVLKMLKHDDVYNSRTNLVTTMDTLK